MLKRHLIAGNKAEWILAEDNLEAGDMNEDEKVDISDLLSLKREVARNVWLILEIWMKFYHK